MSEMYKKYEFKEDTYNGDEKLLSVLIWIGAYFSFILVPIIIYILKGKESKLVENHFKSCINMLLSYSIYIALLTVIVTILGILTFGIGFGLYAIVGVLPLIMIFIGILGILDALKGDARNYMTCIEFLKVK